MAVVIAVIAIAYSVGVRVEGSEGPQASLEKARQAFLSGNDSAAFKTFEPLAKSGNARAQFWVADMYEHGYGVKKDGTTEINWLMRAADEGFTPAEARLGEIYLAGEETLQDFPRARKWLTEAGMSGDAISERHLGHIYELGLGVRRDPAEAYAWYENAILGGDNSATQLRDDLVSRMSPEQLAKGHSRARELREEIKPHPDGESHDLTHTD